MYRHKSWHNEQIYCACMWNSCSTAAKETVINYIKPPNDSNVSTQHIPTLLAQHLQAPAKRSQHLNTTDHNINGRNMLHAFGHPVAMCWELKIGLVRMPRCNIVAQTWPIDHNMMQHPQCCMKNLTIFKFEPTTPNIAQHLATCRNRVAKRTQHVAPKKLQYMLRWNIAIVFPGFKRT